MKTAREWQLYYARERTALGTAGLHDCLDRARPLAFPPGGALVFPHTRLRESGHLTAAVARAVLDSGCETVLALGVLHGARAEDADLVRRARGKGDPQARQGLRRIHGPGVPADEGHWTEEFSLDSFCALLKAAAQRMGRPPPRVACRYPFLVGDQPEDLPGLEELRDLVAQGAVVVGTTDPIHHGRGYGDPVERCFPVDSRPAEGLAHGAVEGALEFLRRQDYAGFQTITAEFRSDFRDVGPILACLLTGKGSLRTKVHDLMVVDYAGALGAEAPTWVGAALLSFRQGKGG